MIILLEVNFNIIIYKETIIYRNHYKTNIFLVLLL